MISKNEIETMNFTQWWGNDFCQIIVLHEL